jgi:hypothetical protein
MRLTLSTRNTNNSGLVDEYNRQLYNVSTSTFGRTTTIRKFMEGYPDLELAVIDFHTFGSDTVTWANGRRIEVDTWMPKASRLSQYAREAHMCCFLAYARADHERSCRQAGRDMGGHPTDRS